MSTGYYLQIGRVTHSEYSGAPEQAADPMALPVDRFIHFYVQGRVPDGGRAVLGKFRPIAAGAADSDLPAPDVVAGGYKFTLTHYVLRERSGYLFRFADDFTDPTCLCSQPVHTLG